MKQIATSYQALRRDFAWDIPARCNIARLCCDDWAERQPDRLAVRLIDAAGGRQDLSYADLQASANRMARVFLAHGLGRGQRIGVLLPQMLETPAAHLAIYKMAAVAVPLFMLFGPDALEHRVRDADIGLIVTNRDGAEKLRAMSQAAQEGLQILTVDGAHNDLGTQDLHAAMVGQPADFETQETGPDDPALIIYTSGTTGAPKGVLHGHRVVWGHLPGMQTYLDWLPAGSGEAGLYWTPADWAWIGGLINVMLSGLALGTPLLAHRFAKFDGASALAFMEREKVAFAFLPPTALKLMRAAHPEAYPGKLALQALGSGGEPLGEEILNWGRQVLELDINQFYGQSECNLIVSCCGALMQGPPASMGRAVAGHDVAVVTSDGQPCAPGELGAIAVKAPDPAMFLRYWNRPDATREKFVGDWMLTGDQGWQDADGWITFQGRDDDVITSAGYRIGPASIEDCLLRHPAVLMAAVIGKPDPERTQIIKAFIVLAEGQKDSPELHRALQDLVRQRLAAHEYPREIQVVEALPMTATGKIQRAQLRALEAARQPGLSLP